MFSSIKRIFAPAAHIERLPENEVKKRYPGYRWRVLEATFLGYAMYYFVRSNVNVASGDMQSSLGYTKEMVGNLMAITGITYGVGKFFMGALSDKSNPRVFMSVGLLITTLLNFTFGWVHNYEIHWWLWAINGFVQGMGWPPCGRSMGHWYSEKERGFTFSIWNTSHNFGGAIAAALAGWSIQYFGGWQYAFFIPGIISGIGAFYILFRLVDTPQSVGLPPVQEYKNDYPADEKKGISHEKELSFKELFFKYVLLNRFVWLLSFANFFAYIARYAMFDWGPTYFKVMHGVDTKKASWAVTALEIGGIPTTILLGWLSDKMGGQRGKIAALCMLPIIGVFAFMPYVPKGQVWMDLTLLLIVGFCIYPVINLIVIMALDLTSKKAIGTAAGFIGLFGYLGKAVMNSYGGKMLDHYTVIAGSEAAWHRLISMFMGASICAFILLMFTWNQKPKG